MTVETLLDRINACRAEASQEANRRYSALVSSLARGAEPPDAGEVSALLAQLGIAPGRLAADVAKATTMRGQVERAAAILELVPAIAEAEGEQLVGVGRLEAAKAAHEPAIRAANLRWTETRSEGENADLALVELFGGTRRHPLALRIEAELAELRSIHSAIARAKAAQVLGRDARFAQLSEADEIPAEGITQMLERAETVAAGVRELLEEAALLEHMDWTTGKVTGLPAEPARPDRPPTYSAEVASPGGPLGSGERGAYLASTQKGWRV